MLRLMQTRMEDAGQYTCVVRNAAGEERKIFGLSVLGTYIVCNIQEKTLIALNPGSRVKIYLPLDLIPVLFRPWTVTLGKNSILELFGGNQAIVWRN